MEKTSNQNKKPVTLITGYLGSGKTTVMNELLKNQSGKRIAVIVNDMGTINLDAALIKENGMASCTNMDLVELQNGCICCTLRDEFMVQLDEIAKKETVDAILVEASGISNPASIAEAFLAYEEVKEELPAFLSSIVTVVDADRIYSEFLVKLEETVSEMEDGEDDVTDDEDPDIINLVMDQIEFCNIILLNKCDLLEPEQLQEVKKVIKSFQPEAQLFETEYGKADAEVIFNHRAFDYEQVSHSSLMGKALAADHDGEEVEGIHEEYGISSFVFEERRPFNRQCFMDFLENDYPETLIRAKGYIWFGDDEIHTQLFEQAGRNASVTEISNWVAALPKDEQEEVFKNYPDVLKDWDAVYGDRLNQIVFIGKGYSKEEIVDILSRCLS